MEVVIVVSNGVSLSVTSCRVEKSGGGPPVEDKLQPRGYRYSGSAIVEFGLTRHISYGMGLGA